MTPVAPFQLSGRIGLFLFGTESLWLGIRFSLITLPQDKLSLPSLGGSKESWCFRLWVLAVCTCFGIGMIVFAVTIPSEQFTSTNLGFLGGISSPFWLAGAVAIVRYTILELKLASLIRRQQRAERRGSMDHSHANRTDL